MPSLKRPLDVNAVAAADEKLYVAHANDPRPNKLYDQNGNRLPLDGSDPKLAEEWRDCYRDSLDAKAGNETSVFSNKAVCRERQECARKHWIYIRLIRRDGEVPEREANQNLKERRDWWPTDSGISYAYEPYSAEITDGPKKNTLDKDAATRYDLIPAGVCSIHFYDFYRDLEQTFEEGGLEETPVRHAILQLTEVRYHENHRIENDTRGFFDAPQWRPDRQWPVCYTSGARIVVIAKFEVTQKPTQTETVEIRASAVFGGKRLTWSGSKVVSPTADEVVRQMTSAGSLPDHVDVFESSDITWEANAAGTGWANAGSSRNTTYVTLGDPSGTLQDPEQTFVYRTLLDVSCRGARGQSTVSGVISGAFEPLKKRNIKRKRDGKALTYWKPRKNCAQTTKALLAAKKGGGECGSWAEFLIDMYRAHGITSVDKILIVVTLAAFDDESDGFLVKNWEFDHPPPSSADSYTHFVPSQCRPGKPLPGQSNKEPPEAFLNHFVVRADGKFWDPSYGAGPFASQDVWENAAIDGRYRDAPEDSPPGTKCQTGFDKSLNRTSNILQFWDLTTGTRI